MLQNKTIVVAGVSSGIGAETAAELERQGTRVIGIDRNPTEAEKIMDRPGHPTDGGMSSHIMMHIHGLEG